MRSDDFKKMFRVFTDSMDPKRILEVIEVQPQTESEKPVLSLPRSDYMERIHDVVVPEALQNKLYTGISFVDDAWDGFTPGTVTAFTGTPGAGKTSLGLAICDALAGQGQVCAFNSTEQAEGQIKVIADRLRLQNPFFVSNHADVDSTLTAAIDVQAEFLVVDSLQTMGLWVPKRKEKELSVGSPTTITAILKKIILHAQEQECAVFLICQMTRSGTIKGPRSIEHDTDIHGHLSHLKGQEHGTVRELLLKKNRYGPALAPYYLDYDGFSFREVSL